MSWKPELPEGITPIQRANIVVLHVADTLRLARSLREMTADWHFFTVGCIYTFGGLDVDVISEYTQTHADRDCSVMKVNAARPLFTGMCPPGWPDKTRQLEHELCVIPLEYWEGLKARIAEISMVDRRKGRFAQVTVQELEILDHLAMDNAIVASPAPPTVPITAFGIDGTHYHVAFMPHTESPSDTAQVIRLPIREETRTVGKAILSHDPRPFKSLELKPADPTDVARKIREAEEKGK